MRSAKDKLMDMILFLALSVVCTAIDLILWTSLYNVKFPIKHYKSMIAVMVIVTLITNAITCIYNEIDIFRQLFQFIIYSGIMCIFSKDKHSILYLPLPALIVMIIDITFYMLIGFAFKTVIITLFLKIFLIYILYEDRNYSLKFNLLPLSIKILIFIFSFMMLTYGNYISMTW